MEYRLLDSSGLQVSTIGIGCWAMGKLGWGEVADNDSVKAIQAAVDCGMTFIDTAAIYGFGHSEVIVGKALKGRREKAVVATKCGMAWTKPEVASVKSSLSRAHILRSCEESLKRLSIDSIDLYQAHWPDGATPIEESMEAFTRLKKEGKIKAFGVSNFSLKQMQAAKIHGDFVSLQSPFSLLTQKMLSDEIPYCQKNNTGFLAYSPLEMGLLTGKYKTPPTFSKDDWRNKSPYFKPGGFERAKTLIELLTAIGKKYGKTSGQTAANWVIHTPGVTVALLGAKTEAQVKENAGAGDWKLDPKDYQRLDQAATKLTLDPAKV